MFEPAWPADMRLFHDAPLPVAQLAAHAGSEASPRRRHDTAFCAFEVYLKLLASLVIAETAARQPAQVASAAGLSTGHVLVKPYWNDWLTSVRTGSEAFLVAGEKDFRLLFERFGDRFPGCRALCSELRSLVSPEARYSTLADLMQLLGTYRNRGWAHVAAIDTEFEKIGRRLIAALSEIMATERAFGGRQFVYVEHVVQIAPRTWQIEHLELRGLVPGRLVPLELEDFDADCVPAPDRLYAINATALSAANNSAMMYSTSCCVGLHPLVKFDAERQECLFAERGDASGAGNESMRYIGYLDCRTIHHQDEVDLLGTNLSLAAAKGANGPASFPPTLAANVKTSLYFGGNGSRHEPSPLGEFAIAGQLAAGAHTDVFKAWQSGVERHVAVKQVRAGAPERAEVDVHNEVHLLGHVAHPNLVQVLSCGHDPAWFAMPLVEGPTLSEVLEALRGFDAQHISASDFMASICIAVGAAEQRVERLSAQGASDKHGEPAARHTSPPQASPGETYLALVARLVGQVASAVDALHRCDIVHGHIHPGNILLSASTLCPTLIDLSDSFRLGQKARSVSAPNSSRFPYASPQQVRAPYVVDKAGDIYNLGVLLWELASLQPLFGITSQTDAVDATLRIQYDQPDSPAKFNPLVPARFAEIVLQCLAKEAEKRPTTAGEVAHLLASVERSEFESRRRAGNGWSFPFSLRWRATHN